jgi:predicted nucleic acid-binding protein
MISRYGIDTSVLVRLITARPPDAFTHCEKRLTALVEGGAEVFASNQVIGEAYVAVQHHYGVSTVDARAALLGVLRSGLVAPMNGHAVIAALEASIGPGLFDRLIADDYHRAGLEVLTLDRQMAGLPHARRL